MCFVRIIPIIRKKHTKIYVCRVFAARLRGGQGVLAERLKEGKRKVFKAFLKDFFRGKFGFKKDKKRMKRRQNLTAFIFFLYFLKK